MSDSLEAWIKVKVDDHQADVIRGGCVCGFAVWSPEHVAIMAYREGRAALQAQMAQIDRIGQRIRDGGSDD